MILVGEILGLVTQAGVTGADFGLWQKVLAHMPSGSAGDVHKLLTTYPKAIVFFTELFKKRIKAAAESDNNLLVATIEEEKEFIKELLA